MEKLKIAIVGCGGIANQKHMPSIRANAEKAEMVAFCDIIPERAQKAACPGNGGTCREDLQTSFQEFR